MIAVVLTTWHECGTLVGIRDGGGLFVPKPTRDVDCQGGGLPDLGSTVRRCPLASSAVGGDSYSFGFSVARESMSRAEEGAPFLPTTCDLAHRRY